jgi:hypothetical protein
MLAYNFAAKVNKLFENAFTHYCNSSLKIWKFAKMFVYLPPIKPE